METVVVGLAASVGPTLVGLAAWRQAKAAKMIVQGNGRGTTADMAKRTLELVEEMCQKIDEHGKWIVNHRITHARQDLREK